MGRTKKWRKKKILNGTIFVFKRIMKIIVYKHMKMV